MSGETGVVEDVGWWSNLVWRWQRMFTNWQKNWQALAILSAFLGAGVLANDTFIMHHRIVSGTYGAFMMMLVYLVLGSVIGLLTNLVYTLTLGKKISPTFTHLSVGTSQFQKLALWSGGLGALSTSLTLIGSQICDASLVIALSSMAVVYVAMYDWRRKEVTLRLIVVPAILAVVGAFLASVSSVKNLEVPLVGIAIFLVGKGGISAVAKILEQKGARMRGDPLNFAFWRFFWLTAVGNVLVFCYLTVSGEMKPFFQALSLVFWSALPWVLLTMFLVFFSNYLSSAAQMYGVLSKVMVLFAIQTALGVPLTLGVDALSPGVFGELPSEPVVWVIRFVGAILITFGCFKLNPKVRESEA